MNIIIMLCSDSHLLNIPSPFLQRVIIQKKILIRNTYNVSPNDIFIKHTFYSTD